MGVFTKTEKQLRIQVLLFAVLALMLFTSRTWAQQEGKLDGMAATYFEPGRKIGIEVELTGLPTEEIYKILSHPDIWGGEVEVKTKTMKVKNPGPGVPPELEVKSFKIRDSKAGKVLVKPEGNELSPGQSVENVLKTSLTEIVTSPSRSKVELEALQKGLDRLKALGAEGTAHGHAVSIQVNLELIPEEKISELHPMELVNLLRNYLKPSNRKIIADEMKVPEFRQSYIGNLTPEMQKRLFNPSYRVETWRELYNDLIYRQTAELTLGAEAWRMEIEKVQEHVQDQVKQRGLDAVLPIVKWNFLRYSSILLLAVPEDAISKFLVESWWVRALPIVEFREANNDFNVLRTVKRMLGIAEASRKEKDFEISEWNEEKKVFSGPVACRNLFSLQ